MTERVKFAQLLIQRDGRVWFMPQREDSDTLSPARTLMGTVAHETRGRTPNRGWRFKCADCTSFYGAIQRTRRDAVLDLIDHWNEDADD